MITFISGDLLKDDADVLVNTVNCRGVMGSGIALQFKERFSLNFLRYQQSCRNGTLKESEILEFKEKGKIIWNLATKRDWRDPSRLSWLIHGCKNLSLKIRVDQIKSIAIPAIGCNNGGADWEGVKDVLLKHLQGLDCDIRLYTPKGVDL